jgi:peroxiredoxin (alkyl hydroperoxide reductase subunit C)
MSLINTEIKPFKATAFHAGKFIDLTEADFKGTWSVLMFYPADFTFVCPTELEDLAAFQPEFDKMGVKVYGVSTDTHFAHKAWHDTSDAIKKVNYPLIGDPTGVLSRNFEVMIEEEGLALRGTFVINPEGQIKVMEVHDNGIGCPVRRVAPGRSVPGQVDRRRRNPEAVAGPGRQDLIIRI